MPFNLSPFSIIKELGDTKRTGTIPESVERVNRFFKLMKPIQEFYERQWFLNVANYMGNQWLVFDRISKRFVVPPSPTWRVRMVINKIMPIGRIQMAKLSELDPQFYVAANSTDEQDVKGAQVGSQLINNIWQSQEFDETFDDIVNWLVTCGNCSVFPFFDNSQGKQVVDRKLVPVVDEESGLPVPNPETGEPLMREVESKFRTGEVNFDIADPFEMVPDFSTTTWREQSAVIKRKLRSVDYVFEKYGVKVDPEVLDFSYDNPMKVMSQATASGIVSDHRQILRHAVSVKDYYEAPTKNFPKGRHIITAKDKLLFEGELETKLNGKYVIPMVHMRGIKIPKRLMGMAPIENILPLQWQYNRGRSQIIEDINTMSRPKYKAPLDSIADDTITDQPGEVVVYDPSAGERGPEVMQGATTIEAGRIDNLNRLVEEMQDIGGVHDISMGRLPRRATSGLALNILEEKDTTVIAPMKKSLRKGLEKIFSFALSIAGDKFKETRILKVLNERQKTDLVHFAGVDLHSNDDVRVLADQPFPQGKAAKLEFALELVKIGLISAQTARKVLSLDGFANIEAAIGDEESRRIAAEQQALAEQTTAARGEQNLNEEARAQEIADELQNKGAGGPR